MRGRGEVAWVAALGLSLLACAERPSEPIPGMPAGLAVSVVSGNALVLHLPFDETGGNVAADVSGGGHTALLQRSAAFDPAGGFDAGAVLLDGVRAHVSVGSSPALNQTTVTARTVAVWFRADDVTLSTRKQIIWLEGESGIGLAIYLHAGRVYVAGWNTSAATAWKGTYLWTTAVQSGRWHHVAVTLNGGVTVSPDALQGWLDGTRFAVGSGAQLDVRGSVSIGANDGTVRLHDAKSTDWHAFAGRLDDLRVYNRQLSETEIATLAAGGLPPANKPPIAMAGPDRTVVPGSTVALDGTSSSDPDNGPAALTYAWRQISGEPVVITDPSSAVASVTLTAAGTYGFELTVSDGEAQSSDQLTITAGHQAPVANAGPDQTVIVGTSVTLDGSGSTDPDNAPQPLTYQWVQLTGPPVTLTGASTAIASFVPAAEGSYSFRLTVSDGALESTDDVAVVAGTSQPGAQAVIPSTTLSEFSGASWATKNQRRAWWNSHRGRWDAVLPATAPPAVGPSDWWIVKGADSFAPEFAAEFDPSTSRTDAFWDDGARMLYIIAARTSKTFLRSYRYDPATDGYQVLVNGVRVSGMDGGHNATIYRTPNGYLWASVMKRGTGAGLWVTRSRDGGATWDGLVNILIPNTGGQTGMTHFVRDGRAYLAIAAAEDGGTPSSRFRFVYIEQSSESWNTAAGWTDESSSMPAFEGSEHSDDEVSVIADAASNIYIAVETEPGADGSHGRPQLVLYKRSPTGVWAQYTINRYGAAVVRKRPTVAIDGSAGRLYVFAVDRHGVELSHASAPLTDLDRLTAQPMTVTMQVSGKLFGNNITPRFPTTQQSGLLILIDNQTDATVWQRRLLPGGVP